MWDRLYDKARWNGVEFYVLKTNDKRGKRLQVEELPNSDNHHLKVMGAKANSYSITAVFAGKDSLSDANRFVASLESRPIGTLEHPYLGELDLVYDESEMETTIKKGVVNLSLSFVKQGKKTNLLAPNQSLNNLSRQVTKRSIDQFESEVKHAEVSVISEIQNEATAVLNKLRLLANKMQIPGVALAKIHRQIRDALSAVTSIINAPKAFAEQLDAVLQSLVLETKSLEKAIKFSGQSSKLNTPIGSRRFTYTELSKTQREVSNPHLKLQLTLTKLNLQYSFELLTQSNSEILSAVNVQSSLFEVMFEVKSTKMDLEERIKEASNTSEYETFELVEQLFLLHAEVIKNRVKLIQISQQCKTQDIFGYTPWVVLAHQNNCQESHLSAMNRWAHPLFIRGKLKVPNG